MYIEGSYGNLYDLSSPILKKDKGLTAEDIPDSFRFRDKQEAFSLLEDMPRDPFTPEGRRVQLQKEHGEVFEVMQLGTPEGLKSLVEDKLKSGEMLSDELLKIIEIVFTDEQPSTEHIQASKEKLNYFLDLQVDGKPLMSEEFIVDLLNSARASGRKDVEEVIWKPCMRIAADAMHQSLKDDPESVKEFVKSNLDDKSASFDDMLEIITIEFTRPAEEYTSDEHIQNSKDVLKFLLNLQVDGKPLMSGEFISKLCNRVLASGRGDVASVILMPYRQFVFHQNIKNNPEVAKVLVKNTLASDGDSDDCLEIIEKEFARPAEEYASDEHIQNSKDMLKFLLDLQVDGKPVMQEEFISKLFKNARISDRKDVEDAILAYKAEHPDDKRFSEKMFEFNRKDKVAEFVKRQERKAAKVQAIVKNAAKKGATTVKGATEKGIVAAKKVTKKDTAVINVVVTGKKGR